MADLAVFAIGFGAIPLAAIALANFREWVTAHQAALWGGLAGVLAFLGLSHAMAFVLESKRFLFGGVSELGSIVFLTASLSVGGGIGWGIFRAPLIPTEPSRVAVAATTFLALHSAGDGLVFGRDLVGVIVPQVRIDAVTISATVVHRLVEGGLVVVPAFAAAWRMRPTFLALSFSLVAIPAAYVPSILAGALGFLGGFAATQALSTFLAAIEAMLVLVVLIRGFLPQATAGPAALWTVWIAVGFIGISVVHFLVE